MSSGPASGCGTLYATAPTWRTVIAPVGTRNGGSAGVAKRNDGPCIKELPPRPASAPCRSGSWRRNPAVWITWCDQSKEQLRARLVERGKAHFVDQEHV